MVKVRRAPILRSLNSVLELLHSSLRHGYRSAHTSTGPPTMTFRLVFGRCGPAGVIDVPAGMMDACEIGGRCGASDLVRHRCSVTQGGDSESGRNRAHRQKWSRNARTVGGTADVTTHDRSPQSVDRLVKFWGAARKYFWPFLDYPCRHGIELENRRFFVLSWFL